MSLVMTSRVNDATYIDFNVYAESILRPPKEMSPSHCAIVGGASNQATMT